MKVESRDGTWHVRRRWAPRYLGAETIWARFWERTRKVRRRTADFGDIPDPGGCGGDIAEGIALFILAVVVILFLIFIGIPFLVALGELLIILVIAIAGIVGKVLFRRPWTIDAVDPSGNRYDWRMVGWRASTRAQKVIAERIAASGSAPSEQEVAAEVLAL